MPETEKINKKCPKCQTPLVKSEYKEHDKGELQCKGCGRIYDAKTLS